MPAFPVGRRHCFGDYGMEGQDVFVSSVPSGTCQRDTGGFAATC